MGGTIPIHSSWLNSLFTALPNRNSIAKWLGNANVDGLCRVAKAGNRSVADCNRVQLLRMEGFAVESRG